MSEATTRADAPNGATRDRTPESDVERLRGIGRASRALAALAALAAGADASGLPSAICDALLAVPGYSLAAVYVMEQAGVVARKALAPPDACTDERLTEATVVALALREFTEHRNDCGCVVAVPVGGEEPPTTALVVGLHRLPACSVEDAELLALATDLLARDAQPAEGVSRPEQDAVPYRAFVDNAGDGICVVQDGVHRYFNDRAADTLGFTREEFAAPVHHRSGPSR